MAKNKKVQEVSISVSSVEAEDYIFLTDIARYRDTDRSDYILQNWLRNRSTIEFQGLWEQFNNQGLNSIELDGFKKQAVYSNSTKWRVNQ